MPIKFKIHERGETNIRGVIIALENWKTVRLDKLSSPYPTIKSTASDTPEKVNASNIKDAGVNYRTGIRLKKAIKNTNLKEI